MEGSSFPGLFEPDARRADHWDAQWAITGSGYQGIVARTSFTLDVAPYTARTWVCAAGLWSALPRHFLQAAFAPPLCLLTVNGVALDVPQRLLARGEAFEIDLADELRAGTNEISVEAVYLEPPTLDGRALPVRIAVLCQADLELPGAPLMRIASGPRRSLLRIMPVRPALPSATWEVLVRRTPTGPWSPADGAFLHPLEAAPLCSLPRRGGRLEREADRDLPRVRYLRHDPVPRRTLQPGASVCIDFGEELVGHLAVRTDGPATLSLAPGESEAEAHDLGKRVEGPVRRAVLEESGVWRDRRRSALRYVVVRNDGGQPATVLPSVDAFEADLELAGSFRCADPLLERIYEVGRRTVLRCTHEHVESAPKRDRRLWTGDLAAVAGVFALTIGDLAPLRRSLLLSAASALRSGALPGVGPNPNDLVAADAMPLWLLAVAAHFRATGDRATASLLLPTVRRVLAFLGERVGPDGLVGPEEDPDWWLFLDWDRHAPFGCPVERQGSVTALSLLTIAALRASASLAHALGHEPEAVAWSTAGERLAERVVERCVDDGRRLFVDWVRGGERSGATSAFTTACALLARVGDASQRQALAAALASDTLRPSTTPWGRVLEVEALLRAERADVALPRIRDYWGGMLARGATTFWEAFDPEESPDTALDLNGQRFALALCHARSGAIAATLAGTVLGVRPREPGFTAVDVVPCLGDLAWAEGVVPTPRGPISVRFGEAAGDVELPPGVSARVRFKGRETLLPPGRHTVS
jgi:hypothetical protein